MLFCPPTDPNQEGSPELQGPDQGLNLDLDLFDGWVAGYAEGVPRWYCKDLTELYQLPRFPNGKVCIRLWDENRLWDQEYHPMLQYVIFNFY